MMRQGYARCRILTTPLETVAMTISERAMTEFSFTLSESTGAVWVYKSMRDHWKTISVTIFYRAAI